MLLSARLKVLHTVHMYGWVSQASLLVQLLDQLVQGGDLLRPVHEVTGWEPVPQVCGLGWQVVGAELGWLDAGCKAYSAGRFVLVELRVLVHQLFHLMHLLNDVLRGLSISNIVDGTDKNDFKPVGFVTQVHSVQYSG